MLHAEIGSKLPLEGSDLVAHGEATGANHSVDGIDLFLTPGGRCKFIIHLDDRSPSRSFLERTTKLLLMRHLGVCGIRLPFASVRFNQFVGRRGDRYGIWIKFMF